MSLVVPVAEGEHGGLIATAGPVPYRYWTASPAAGPRAPGRHAWQRRGGARGGEEVKVPGWPGREVLRVQGRSPVQQEARAIRQAEEKPGDLQLERG